MNIEELSIISDYMSLISLRKLSEKYHMRKDKIKKILRKSGLKIHSRNDMSKIVLHYKDGNWPFWKPFSDKVEQIIVGDVTGDAHLKTNTKFLDNILPDLDLYEQSMIIINYILNKIDKKEINDKNFQEFVEKFNNSTELISKFSTASFRIETSIIEKKKLELVQEIFSTFGYNPHIKDSYRKGKDGKFRWYSRLMTQSSVQIQKLYEFFYQNGVKRIPRDLKLTPIILLYFFLGDGSFNNHQIHFSTNCYLKEDVEFLADLIQLELDIETHVYPKSEKDEPDKVYWILVISGKDNISTFLEYISQSDPESYNLAKREFSWKFDGKLRKDLVLKSRSDEEHIRKYLFAKVR
ncbi:MAG: hypothetical protein HeimC3_53700 [Candidatus Heimdallarchaeota archaeon LC_3]|nr:MAG: hypothetical protein HeimC3_53700 [Candidatus Heimdallarchaeota archaeon LC_3]